MHHLTVGALMEKKEVYSLLRQGKVAVVVDGVEAPEGVASEEPAIAWACGVVGCGPSGGEAYAFRTSDATLVDGDFGPSEGVIEVLVGRGEG